ncbi:nitroreductase [Litorimonas haliclonae]|uniref:nitroreductase family protein n=1 Tax=Litorimonas haliclonae TaxID=2081977 RepID=UPI0039F14425
MTDSQKTFPLPSKKPDLIEFLKTRRSNLAKVMSEPGPTETQIGEILKIAARVPDHRKLEPWRFVVFRGEARARFGRHIASAFIRDNPDMPEDRAIFEGERFLRAPVVIAVISSPVECPRGTPQWEQELSAGAVCLNMCLAAQAHGFGAQWLTEWYGYDEAVNKALGLNGDERVAGYIYIGTPELPATPRDRPNMRDKVTHWTD